MKRIFNLFSIALLGATVISCAKYSMGDGLAYPEFGYAAEDPGAPDPEEGDRFGEITDNPFIKTSEQNVSTFSIDADEKDDL